MSMTEIAPAKPDRKAIAAKSSRPGRVTGALRVACKAIVWEGQELDTAAKAANLTTRALRLALERPHVIAFLRAEREVFRAHVSAQNIHYAREMRNTSTNAMARLGAMRFIEQLGEESGVHSAVARGAPGITIVINAAAERDPPPVQVIENVDANNSPQMVRDDDRGRE